MDSYPEYGYTYPSNVGIPYPYPPAVMDTVSVSTRRLGYIQDTRIRILGSGPGAVFFWWFQKNFGLSNVMKHVLA